MNYYENNISKLINQGNMKKELEIINYCKGQGYLAALRLLSFPLKIVFLMIKKDIGK